MKEFPRLLIQFAYSDSDLGRHGYMQPHGPYTAYETDDGWDEKDETWEHYFHRCAEEREQERKMCEKLMNRGLRGDSGTSEPLIEDSDESLKEFHAEIRQMKIQRTGEDAEKGEKK